MNAPLVDMSAPPLAPRFTAQELWVKHRIMFYITLQYNIITSLKSELFIPMRIGTGNDVKELAVCQCQLGSNIYSSPSVL